MYLDRVMTALIPREGTTNTPKGRIHMSTIPPEVPINHEAAAQAFIAGLQALHDANAAQMGDLIYVGPAVRRRLNATAHLPAKLIEGVAALLDAQPELAGLSPSSAAKMRDVIPSTAALTAVGDFLELLARKYHETAAVRRSDVGQDVLRVYNIVKKLNRESDLQEFFPQVHALQQALGSRARKTVSKKAKAAAAATQAAAHTAAAKGVN
jgi:hypothetical protein